MANGIRTGDPHGFNKGRSSKFREGSRVRQTPKESRRTYRPKRCGNNNKDEDNSLKTLKDKNILSYFLIDFFFSGDISIIIYMYVCVYAQIGKTRYSDDDDLNYFI